MADLVISRPDLSLKDIAEQCGVTTGAVVYACKQTNTPLRHPNMSVAQKRRHQENRA